jgi:hypothetical protein
MLLKSARAKRTNASASAPDTAIVKPFLRAVGVANQIRT